MSFWKVRKSEDDTVIQASELREGRHEVRFGNELVPIEVHPDGTVTLELDKIRGDVRNLFIPGLREQESIPEEWRSLTISPSEGGSVLALYGNGLEDYFISVSQSEPEPRAGERLLPVRARR